MLPKLVRSYAIDAVESGRGDDKGARKRDAEEFLARLAEAEIESYEAIGLGTDLRFASHGVIGGGLAVDDQLIHLAAFAVESDSVAAGSDSGNMARMRARRRSYRRR